MGSMEIKSKIAAKKMSERLEERCHNSKSSLRRRFESPPTAGGGADHRSTVGTGARWRHRGAIQDALGGTLRTFLGAGNGPTRPPLPYLALLGRNPGPAPPNQPPLPPNADRGGTARALPQERRTYPSAGLRLCSLHRLTPSLPRHSIS